MVHDLRGGAHLRRVRTGAERSRLAARERQARKLVDDQADSLALAGHLYDAEQRAVADLSRADLAAHHVAVAALTAERRPTFPVFRPNEEPPRSPLAPNAPNLALPAEG